MHKRAKLESVTPEKFQMSSVNLSSSNQLDSVLNSSNLSPGKPTLILAECVFMYSSDLYIREINVLFIREKFPYVRTK